MADNPAPKGRYTARLAAGAADVAAAQALRYRAFHDPAGKGRDADRFDAQSSHFLIEGVNGLVCTFRFEVFATAKAALAGYSAEVYDLAPLTGVGGPMVEMGRFCLLPESHDPDILRLAWAAMTKIVDDARAALLFGCSSFRGTDSEAYADAFRLLSARHIGPDDLRPAPKARETMLLPNGEFDAAKAQKQMPPLLRTYLLMGGWVSDHVVVDRVMNTQHVFTGVEVGKVPAARARALRALAGD